MVYKGTCSVKISANECYLFGALGEVANGLCITYILQDMAGLHTSQCSKVLAFFQTKVVIIVARFSCAIIVFRGMS